MPRLQELRLPSTTSTGDSMWLAMKGRIAFALKQEKGSSVSDAVSQASD
jgi:hypothetical protein